MKLIWISLAAFLLWGCSALSVGEEQTFAEEHGYDLSDAGVLWHPWIIIHDKAGANKAAYHHLELGEGQ